MKLSNCKINEEIVVKDILLENNKLSLRLQELGLYKNSKIKVLFFSSLKQTLLVQIFNSAFTIKKSIASQIEVYKS